MREKLRLFPDGCLALAEGCGAASGYAVAYPWRLGAIAPLDTYFGALSGDADCLYVHDVAVLPAARGNGAAVRCISHMREVARRRALARLGLLSLYGTAAMWGRSGFVADDAIDASAYGAKACYMTAPV